MARNKDWHPVLGSIPDHFVAAKSQLRDRLLATPVEAARRAQSLRAGKRFAPTVQGNVIGFGVGERVTAGERTGELAVKVFVAKKYPKSKVPRAEMIPKTVDGLPVDVEGVGFPRKFVVAQRARFRPVQGGISTGLAVDEVGFKFAGTLGAIVIDSDDDSTVCGLSNNHVFADENRAQDDAIAVQPGTLDSTAAGGKVGTLHRYEPLKFDNKRNWMDAGLAKITSAADPTIYGIGIPAGSAVPALNATVRKSGRTSGLTEGIVRAVRFDVFNVEYDQGMVRVDDCIVIEGTSGSFSRAGDSGSVIIDAKGKVVALLFAGSDQVTYAIPIRRVLKRLRAKLVT